MRIKGLIWLVAAFATLVLWGCGSNGSSGGDSTGGAPGYGEDADGNSYAGAGECIKCHQDFSWSAEHVSEYLASKHVIHSKNINAGSSSSCLECHDPIGDSATVEPSIDPADIPDAGLAAVGCENCHGGGGNHFGVGPMPTPNPTYAVCGDCHNNPDGHPGDLFDKVINSKHSSTKGSSAKCQRCHSTEGSIAFAAYTGDQTVMNLMDAIPVPDPISEVTPPLCLTCHDPHGLELLEVANWDPNGNREADQFDLCTSCHTYFNQDGVLTASGSAASATAPFYHETRWNRIIATTHYDDPDTGYAQAENIIEGYNLRKNSKNPCFDCHGHELRTETGPTGESNVHTDWASSAHGGALLEAKYDAITGANDIAEVDAVMAAGREDGVDHGWSWTHYNWDDSDGLTGSSRSNCQRCHTATGAANFMEGPDNYDPENNDFSHLDGWTSDNRSSGQNEMLYCWGCHSNAGDGKLRDPGAITEEYDPLVIVSYPDVAGSNVCMTCHLGRETGEVIKTKSGFDDLSFVNSHYLSAGGQVFAQTGYTFDDRDYSIPDSDPHVLLGWEDTGIDAIDDNYNEGPCVTCHFDSNDGSHTLSPFTQYAADDLALNPVCVNCHDSRGEGSDAANAWFGHEFTVDDLVAGELAPHKGRYLAGLQALKELLDAEGFYFQTSYPYFFSVPGSTSFADAVKDWTGGGSDTDGMSNMGACFNYNLLIHDPGGVAHNRRYTRRLIYDAIDWIDDKQFNYSVNTTLNALDDTTAYKTSAISYLLNGDNGNAGDRH